MERSLQLSLHLICHLKLSGGKAIAVPGIIAGYYAAWEKYGRIPWEDLFKPSIRMAKHGIYVNKHLEDMIADKIEYILHNPHLR